MHGSVARRISTRIPTAEGEFILHLYRAAGDDKDHLALALGKIDDGEDLLVRIHSECFTGDVLGSRRCDCGAQLERATRLISREGRGLLVYMRQEGRGIGLLQKLRAYNLQDEGLDTVDANHQLGHQADEREYVVAAAILRDLGVHRMRLLTNNPSKIESLRAQGIGIDERVPLETPVHPENRDYLLTKARRMRHLLHIGPAAGNGSGGVNGHGNHDAADELLRSAAPLALLAPRDRRHRPVVTLTYAQSLDGSITVRRGETMALSGPESMTLTHALRAQHDALLVGIDTVLTDDPRLNVRLVDGPDPQPIVLDSRLRTPVTARLFRDAGKRPWIATTAAASRERQRRLEAAGAVVLRTGANQEGQVDLEALLPQLTELGVRSLMVEGGARVITSFLAGRLVDRLVLTIAPLLVGGLNAVGNLAERNGTAFPALRNPQYQWLGEDLVLLGDLERGDG